MSDPVPELFPVRGRHDWGYLRPGIGEGEEGTSSLWILPVPPGFHRAALGMHGSDAGGLREVKITDVGDPVGYVCPYIIKLYTEQQGIRTEVM